MEAVEEASSNTHSSSHTETKLSVGFCLTIEASPLAVTSYVQSPAKEHWSPERLAVTSRSLTNAIADGA